MFDRTIPMIALTMQAEDLSVPPVFDLPEKYAWRYYRPGDAVNWARIEMSADGFPDIETGLEWFRKWFPTDDDLDERMMYLTDAGVPFGTATVWYDREDEKKGRIHWVCIDAEHQGMGLSKVLVSMVMQRMRDFGYTSAFLTTQTSSWVAIKVYHRFGFKPVITSQEEIRGWKIVSEKTGIDFMQYIK